MNFSYSYRAFLITTLLFGILFLLLYSLKLQSETEPELEKYDVEYTQEKEPVVEEEIAPVTAENVKIETNRAYNEAEKLLKDVENQNMAPTETTEGKLAEMEKAIDNASASYTTSGLAQTKKKPAEKNAFSNGSNKTDAVSVTTASNRRTTISYRLNNRNAVVLPNPVYTCEGGGKIVINIEVDATGNVSKATYNRAASTTTNGCLIESAIAYAETSSFSKELSKNKQLGTITYNFPGQ